MNKFSIYLHPFYWISLTVLIVNDLILKAHYPSFITGKLSDFAGLVVLPLFIFGICPRLFRSTKSQIALLSISGAVLVLIQFPPVLHFLNVVLESLYLPAHNLTPDYSDFIALSILPFVYLLMKDYFHNDEQTVKTNHSKKVVPYFILGSMSFIALCATSFIGTKTVSLNQNISSAEDFERTVYNFQNNLIENDINVTASHLHADTVYSTHARFNDDLWFKSRNELNKSHVERIEGRLSFTGFATSDSLLLSDFTLTVSGYKIEDSTVSRIFNQRFKPLLD
jgi:hypothetical protein